MSQTDILELPQTQEMPLINETLMDEIESLNAIFGGGTLCVTRAKGDGIETQFRLPAPSPADQLTFCIIFPDSYPDSAPVYLRADVGLFQSLDRRIQNIGLIVFTLLEYVFVPGNVCIFDLIDVVLPMIGCMEEYTIDLEKVELSCPQLSHWEWRWAEKTFVNMNTYKERVECVICCDEDYAFKMVQVPCKHSYCFNCFEMGWDLAKESVEPYICCKIRIPVETIHGCTTATMETISDYTRQLSERDTWNPFFCGNKHCTALIGSLNLWDLSRGSLKQNGVACPKCQMRTCSVCRDLKHVGICLTEVELIQLFKRADIRRCPKCGDAIEKNGGCSHIQCRRCNSHYMWEKDGTLGKYLGPIYELNGR